MSIKSEIERIRQNIRLAYEEVENKGGNVSNVWNSGNLPLAINSIPITAGETLPERTTAFHRVGSVAGGVLTIPDLPRLPKFISSPPNHVYQHETRKAQTAFIFCLCADGSYYGTKFPDSSSSGTISDFDLVAYNFQDQTLKLAFDPLNNSWINLSEIPIYMLI